MSKPGGTLVWGFVCQGGSAMQRMFCPSSVSLFDLKARFFIPTRSSARPSRAGAVKVGRRTNLSTCFALARPYLDSFEHDGTLGGRDDDQRGARFRARINRATTLYSVGPPDPNHDAAIR